jgi:RES domain-containing protein
MLLYRLTSTKYANDLRGTGAMKKGGRWNMKGTPVLYTSDSAALAILEYLANIDHDLAPEKLSLVIIEIPASLKRENIDEKALPKKRDSYPAPEALAVPGTEWADSARSLSLSVPSVHVPESEGRNFIVNPLHPDFKKITIEKIIPYSFDKRYSFSR